MLFGIAQPSDTPFSTASSPIGDIIAKSYDDTLACILHAFKDVLESENAVSVASDFFELGGSSISAALLRFRLSRSGFVLSVAEIFDKRTPEAIAKLLMTKRGDVTAEPVTSQHSSGHNDTIDLANIAVSSIQEQMLILHEMDPYSAAYNVPICFAVDGCDDKRIAALTRAVAHTLGTHAALRSRFCSSVHDDSCTSSPQRFEVCIADLDSVRENIEEAITTVEVEDADRDLLQTLLNDEFNVPFAVYEEPLLFRARVFACPNRIVLLITLHHLVVDGISVDVLRYGVLRKYTDLMSCDTSSVSPMPCTPQHVLDSEARRYLTSMRLQHRIAESGSEQFQKQLAYWKKSLGNWHVDEHESCSLLPKFISTPTAISQSAGSGVYELALGSATWSKLSKLSSRCRGSPFAGFLSALQLLFSMYFRGSGDMRIGVAVSKRGEIQSHGAPMVGNFVNTLPFPNADCWKARRLSFVKLVSLTAKRVFSLLENSVPSVRDLFTDSNSSHVAGDGLQGLFETVISFSEADETMAQSHSVVPFDIMMPEPLHPKFGLAIQAFVQHNGELAVRIDYDRKIYARSLLEHAFGQLPTLLERALLTPNAALSSIRDQSVSSEVGMLERSAAMSRCSRSECNQRFITDRVGSTPSNSTALQDGDISLSYGELSTRFIELAEFLSSSAVGICAESVVGIVMERSVEYVISVLACWHLGATVVPIDLHMPAKRMRYNTLSKMRSVTLSC